MTSEVPYYTGNRLKDTVLFLIVCGTKVDRVSMSVIHPSYKYLSKVLVELQKDGLINISKSRPTCVGLATGGLDLIQMRHLPSYEHYMRVSNNNHPGGTKRHIEIMRRSAGVLSYMFKSEILIGPQKPSLRELVAGTQEKLDVSVPTFYLSKEIRYSDEQKESRAQTTRASGVLFSKGTRALVYNTIDRPMRLPRRAEREANIRIVRQARDIYKNADIFETQDSIIFCEGDEDAVRIFNTRAEERGGVKLIGDAIWDKTLTGTGFRYIPMNPDGAMSLRHISSRTRKEFLHLCFTEQEQADARSCGAGEGIIKGLYCYEYLSCNVSKLAYIKRRHKSLSNVGIVCWEGQVPFVTAFLGEENLHARVIRRESINEILGVGEVE